jgi:hypothetical protein
VRQFNIFSLTCNTCTCYDADAVFHVQSDRTVGALPSG